MEHYGFHVQPEQSIIRSLAFSGEVHLSAHATERILERGIDIDMMLRAIVKSTEIIKEYPNDPRGHSCLIEAFINPTKRIHCVCAIIKRNILGDKRLVIITVFDPDEDQ